MNKYLKAMFAYGLCILLNAILQFKRKRNHEQRKEIEGLNLSLQFLSVK